MLSLDVLSEAAVLSLDVLSEAAVLSLDVLSEAAVLSLDVLSEAAVLSLDVLSEAAVLSLDVLSEAAVLSLDVLSEAAVLSLDVLSEAAVLSLLVLSPGTLSSDVASLDAVLLGPASPPSGGVGLAQHRLAGRGGRAGGGVGGSILGPGGAGHAASHTKRQQGTDYTFFHGVQLLFSGWSARTGGTGCRHFLYGSNAPTHLPKGAMQCSLLGR